MDGPGSGTDASDSGMANTAAIWSKAFHRSYFPGIRTPIDKPHLRIGSLEADIRAGNEREFLARRRIAALKRHGRPGKEQGPPALKPVPGASNWVQVGPMSTTNGPPYAKNLQFWTGRISSILIDPTAAGTMYIGAAKGGVWKTTDGGKKWAPMSDDEMSLAIGAMALAPNDAQTVYAGTGEGNIFYVVNVPDSTQESYYGAGFLKSTNGGTSWNLYGQAEFTGGAFFRIAVHPAMLTSGFSSPHNLALAAFDGFCAPAAFPLMSTITPMEKILFIASASRDP